MTEQIDRVALAVELFKQGFNCSQSVTAAFADLYGLTREQALRVSASFGGGMGRMREVCGAVSGMFVLAGLDCGSPQAGDAAGKEYNYRVVQMLAEKFREHNGSIVCRELLGLSKGSPVPAERNAEYYRKRPCVQIVADAAAIFNDYLNGKENDSNFNSNNVK
ncbi:MAG: C-GCAxxG-C-C family protein [Bacteroidaceae bacterium]|nr:C-GCAxxG-C-C family protein [Bacteroidaceae bacterium]